MAFHQSLAEWANWVWPLLANHLWQSTVLSIAALAFAALLKKAPGRARYAVFLIASAKFVIPSSLLVAIAGATGLNFSSLFASNSKTSEGFTVIYQLTAPIIQLDQSANWDAAAATHNELLCVLSIVWSTGCLILLALWWKRRHRFRTAMRRFLPAALVTRERATLARVSSWLGIRRGVRISVLR